MTVISALPLPASVDAPRLARRHLECLGSDWPGKALEVALLLTSELVTNAVRYGWGRIQLRVRLDPTVLRVEVSDANPQLNCDRPAPQPHDLNERGRGLLIVAALAHRWGTGPRQEGPGKTVWFELPVALRPRTP